MTYLGWDDIQTSKNIDRTAGAPTERHLLNSCFPILNDGKHVDVGMDQYLLIPFLGG